MRICVEVYAIIKLQRCLLMNHLAVHVSELLQTRAMLCVQRNMVGLPGSQNIADVGARLRIYVLVTGCTSSAMPGNQSILTMLVGLQGFSTGRVTFVTQL